MNANVTFRYILTGFNVDQFAENYRMIPENY